MKQRIELTMTTDAIPSEVGDVIARWVETSAIERAAKREREIRVLLQPKPRWLPQRMWVRIIGRLLVIEDRPA